MRNARLLVIAILIGVGGCADAFTRPPPSAASAAPSSETPRSCSFDSECGIGSCRFGTCSPFPPDGTNNNGCTMDMDCPGGHCEFSGCAPGPRSQACTFDSDCSSGNCVAGTCF
jgi:hypothetical protein